jgi:putative aldouronate transport system substrate-binding protein
LGGKNTITIILEENMKKMNLFILVIAVFALAGQLWAGGGNQQSTQTAGPLTISVTAPHWAPWPVPAEESVFFQAMEKATGAKFTFDWRQTTDYNIQLATVLASGKLPDMLGPHVLVTPEALHQEGAIIALDELLERHGRNIINVVGANRMGSWRSVDGHIYRLTGLLNLEGSHSWMIRQDWLDQLNLKAPSTWDEWLTVWRAFRDNDLRGSGTRASQIPLAFDMNGNRAVAGLMYAFGICTSGDAQFCLYNNRYIPVYEHPRFTDFLQAAAMLYREGILDREFATRSQADLFTIMDSGLCGSTMTWAERASISTTVNRQAGNANAFWRTVVPVKGPFGDQFIEGRNPWVTSLCITTEAQRTGKAERIVQIFDWIFGDKGIEAYSYGIEGQTFCYVNGRPIVKPALLEDSFVSYRSAGLQYAPFVGLWTEDAYMQCLTKGEPYERLPDQIKSFYDGLFTLNKGYHFTWLETLNTEAYLRYSAELITSGVCVLRDRCIAGQITVDEFTRQYQALKARGFQQIIDQGTAAYAAKTR